MQDTPYTLIPLHKRTELTAQCCKLLNSEWPRSEGARLRSLKASNDKFPTCLVLLDDTYVIGHCKISLIPKKSDSCLIMSVVIDPRYRSRGLGTMLMRGAEEYVARKGIVNIFLTTKGQEKFYKKLGYKVCNPFAWHGLYRGNDSVSVSNKLSKDSRSIGPPPPPMPIIKNSGFPFSTEITNMMKKI